MRFVAIVLLVLGLVSVNNGLTLVGSPSQFQNLTEALFSPGSLRPGCPNNLPAVR